MKLAIISDTHDNLANLEKFLEFAKKEEIGGIIHCGDITNSETLEFLAKDFNGPIHFVFGNVANGREELEETAKNYKNLKSHGDQGEIEWEGKRLGFCHKPEEAKEMAQSGPFDFIFYGHTHLPWIEKSGGTLIANPGTLGGVFTEATFAVLDPGQNKLDLKTLFRL